MQQVESLEEFYQHKMPGMIPINSVGEGSFNVFRMEDCFGPDGPVDVPYARRLFYKASLVKGDNLYHFADRTVQVNEPTLMFFHPLVPYSWDGRSRDSSGFFCIFREPFFMERLKQHFRELPMFDIGDRSCFTLNKEQEATAVGIFRKMYEEMHSDYADKEGLLLTYLMELIHFALRLEPSQVLHRQTNANTRITKVFRELLERQFPIASPQYRIRLRSAKDYAEQLYVHVNHLNRAVREITGKTTSDVIAQRILSEAKALLRHTDWSISDISYALGFLEPAHFNQFFRKYVEDSPSGFRVGAPSIANKHSGIAQKQKSGSSIAR